MIESTRGLETPLTLVLVIDGSMHALADDIDWNNPVGGDFGSTANWDPASIPGPGDVAHFGVEGWSYTVTFPGDVTNRSAGVSADTVIFELGGSTWTLTPTLSTNPGLIIGEMVTAGMTAVTLHDGAVATSGEVLVGHQRISRLYINETAVLSSSVDSLTHASVVSVTGEWSMTGDLTVGEDGTLSTLEIEDGGRVSNASGFVLPLIHFHDPLGIIERGIPSTAVVSGAGSAWLVDDSLHIDRSDVVVEAGGTLVVANETVISGVKSGNMWLDDGTLTLNGGTFRTGSLSLEPDAGFFNFISGTLNITRDLVIGSTGPLEFNVSAAAGQTLILDGVTVLEAGSSLKVDGGTFSTGSLAGSGGFGFNTGVFELTQQDLTIGAGGLFGDHLLLDPGQTLNVTNRIVVESGGVLAPGLGGRITAGAVVNNRQMLIEGLVSSFGADTVTNNSSLTGDGRLSSTLLNTAPARSGSAPETPCSSRPAATRTTAGSTSSAAPSSSRGI